MKYWKISKNKPVAPPPICYVAVSGGAVVACTDDAEAAMFTNSDEKARQFDTLAEAQAYAATLPPLFR